VTRRIFLTRGGTKAIAACVVLITALATTGQPASAAVSLTFVRQIGGPGHATVYPWGLTTAPDGSILITDYWNWRVARYSTSGAFLGDVVTATTKGSQPQQHLSPYGVATDPRNGDVYFGDVDSGATVDKYTASGTFIRSIGGLGSGTGKFQYPAYVAVNSQGRLYVVDSRQPNVEVFDPNGTFLFQFGTSGSGRLATPRGIAIDAQDRVYIADNWNHRVAVFNADGTFLYGFGSSGTAPGQFGPGGDLRGVAVDATHGWVYVVDSALNVIDKFGLAGNFIMRWGSYGTGAGKFIEGGRGVTVDGDGNVWVADLGDFRVQKFDSNGGFLAAYPSLNEVPPLGGFNAPTDVAVAPDGSIYVTDQRNWRIEKFAPNGTFQLAWGNRGGGPYGFNYARGLAVDPRNGDVLVADSDNAKLKRFTSSGTYMWTSGGSGSSIGRIKAYSLDVGPDGTIYFANHATPPDIVILDANGGLIRRWGSGTGRFLFPRGIALDADGTLWISDSQRSTNVIQHFSATGTFLGGFGTRGTAADQINQAGDVVVDANYIYVADTNANRVKIFTKSGTFVGATLGGGTAPGRMLGPIGMDMTANGHIYVTEQGGERVQEFAVMAS
jgi:tripartite motif-containing protein 71